MTYKMQHAFDPLLCMAARRFVVGQDGDGRWVVRDEDGLIGGVFRSRDAATHFAIFESGHRHGAVRFAPDGVCLSLMGPLPSLCG